jgi:hypothetical protein
MADKEVVRRALEDVKAAAAHLERAQQHRDETVRAARQAGATFRAIAVPAGLAHGTIRTICER